MFSWTTTEGGAASEAPCYTKSWGTKRLKLPNPFETVNGVDYTDLVI